MGRVVVLLFALALAAACGRGQSHGAVVVVLDTLRADHLGAYGYPRATSPALDQLAESGVLFEQAVSPSNWTLPAMISLLTGRYTTAEVFSGELRTSLVETLHAGGVRTVAFTEGGFVSEHFGLDLGFETWQETEGPVRLVRAGRAAPGGGQGGIEHTFARARQWLRDHGEQPFFLLIHTYEVHAPYQRPPWGGGEERAAWVRPSRSATRSGCARANSSSATPSWTTWAGSTTAASPRRTARWARCWPTSTRWGCATGRWWW